MAIRIAECLDGASADDRDTRPCGGYARLRPRDLGAGCAVTLPNETAPESGCPTATCLWEPGVVTRVGRRRGRGRWPDSARMGRLQLPLSLDSWALRPLARSLGWRRGADAAHQIATRGRRCSNREGRWVTRSRSRRRRHGGAQPPRLTVFGVKYFCRSTSTILAGSDGCSFDDAPFAGRCCGF